MDADELKPPPPLGALRQVLAMAELPRLAWSARRLASLERGRGAPVLVLPGFGTGDASTLLLRGYLRRLGYAVEGWGMGRNGGDVEALVPRVISRTEATARRAGPVALVGWSLGGVLARETARERPELVRRVVTLGTPVLGGPKYTLVANYYRDRGVDLDALEREIGERNREPIRVPVTAIYSRNDGVVAWRACIDPDNEAVEHVEVETNHTGLGFSPEVYEIVSRRLALDPAEAPRLDGPAAAAQR